MVTSKSDWQGWKLVMDYKIQNLWKNLNEWATISSPIIQVLPWPAKEQKERKQQTGYISKQAINPNPKYDNVL